MCAYNWSIAPEKLFALKLLIVEYGCGEDLCDRCDWHLF